MHAPEVGYGGYLGTPSLSTIPSSDDPEELPFGYLYEPLEELGLRTYDLEVFKAFLRKHDGHRLYAYSDHQDEFPPELEEIFRAGTDEASSPLEALVSEEDFVDSVLYELECLGCQETYRAQDEACLRSFDQFDVPQATVDLYLERWGSLYPDDGWNYRLNPLVDPFFPFMEQLPEFLRQHRSHRLLARLVR